ncbi:MAG: dCTP deaminase [Candidatus Doudnabacteria bacterium RIFCSPLOWO2_02_FULL_42_9]|uniref:dCTP deaminase n=1 Tax=Candidatus Doudnabacteria bacterium RIFCSPHIGHO2_01_FULL_41_86 TaxID=1817821 RepID=A0A1F5N8I0_9BACT|nr:MAG: dCTP deaminase [Candidatus Doudnabacteria bacterium RIFCSPHIGHO2_01_FULL_41_86]OGE75851.1 MAG: dCTP deaminase [Candidatus Doudnabacteria bacterium RIFCSPHIGHO2_01_43_10]OGE86225.1 MAG: dCTP deaminase [Candidatus Doudnabacteria bacterium RIFCSPHIGHO2_12_FULL_42_22]OGE87074.1 MAG: dCTP deaminase [Candidatus Doudnabacteria bacterium RIFCSPHIGHO2_02_FULL_42_25]OGE92213.1 MAG: dCTP deaminase [Candidatus Doudnabacteria bacterium RIFCSPLOWO2_01_FULL_42_60]OGE92926.1 MAG: dCTP deaminase [Candi
MILSDTDIKTKLDTNEIKIDPMPNLAEALGTVSVDLRLGNDFILYRSTSHSVIDARDKKIPDGIEEKISVAEDGDFVIRPRDFVLGSTLEKIELPASIAGRLEGKSSLGRLGLVIHSTAGKVDPGFKGNLVLEITNIGTVPIVLHPGMRICQLLFEQLSSPTSKPYVERDDSKYKNQDKTVGSIL